MGRPRDPRDQQHHPLPAKIYANEGICQVLFYEADADDICKTSYKDKKGKYQAQTGVTLPRL